LKINIGHDLLLLSTPSAIITHSSNFHVLDQPTQLSATKLFWVLIQPRNEKNHALEKVEFAQNKNPLVFSEVMAFARIFTHFTQNVWIFFVC
jgi:hypothetical protein